jgi:SAM-dependent methyltransferase
MLPWVLDRLHRRDEGGAARPAGPYCRMCGHLTLATIGTVRGYLFLECSRCGFTFAPSITRPAVDALLGWGDRGPDDASTSEGSADPGFLRPALDRLAGSGPLTILDFGTGQSRVPGLLRACGHRVIAVDLAPPFAPHPDRLTGSLHSLRLPRAAFDLAFAFQVFEHLPEPRPYLDELLRIVRPGGLVLIHTDMEVPERAAGFEQWPYVLPPDHCSFYRHRTFDAALERSPHRIAWKDPKCVIIEVGRAGAAAE